MTARWTWHGGGLAAARAYFGGDAGAWLDLSTGINPMPWPGADRMEIDWRALPDEDGLRALEQAAADHFGVDAAHVCALPGTEVGLRLIGAMIDGPVHHVAPAYRTHGDMAPGARPVAIDRVGDIEGGTIILANPNNPDGRVYDPGFVDNILKKRGKNGWVIVDEAFADSLPDRSAIASVCDDRRLMLFRSFGKFFGLAGLRLGFLVGPTPLIAQCRARLGAWPVSAAAIAIGTAAYRDAGWIAQMRDRLPRAAAALDALLARCGYHATGACPLFRLIGTEDANAIFTRLARQAILTRPFDYNPRWLRVGLPPDDAALARLEAALCHG